MYLCKKTTTATHHLLYIQKDVCFFIFGVVLGARHKSATTGNLRVVTIVYAKVEVGITIWYPEKNTGSPKVLQVVVFGTGIPAVFFWGSWFLRHAHIDATSACYKTTNKNSSLICNSRPCGDSQVARHEKGSWWEKTSCWATDLYFSILQSPDFSGYWGSRFSTVDGRNPAPVEVGS